jgi:cytoskeletal protein RodZ
MKRCPQCEFIYEDEQGRCDMDGVRLVADFQLLSDPVFAAIDVGSLVASSQASQWRSLALPAVGAVILGVVLFLVYYVSTHQTAPQNIHYSSAQVSVDSQSAATQSAPNPALTQAAAPPSQIDAELTASPIESIQPPASAKRSSAPSATPAPKREEKKRRQDRAIRKSNSADSKKDSKVGSLLKKAGNILKMPFKH